MCTNEETKKRVRQRLDGILLGVKVAQTVESHRDPEGGDAVVEALMEELMKLHSCYGKERVSAGCEKGERIATDPAEPRNDTDNTDGDTCGCPDGEDWNCQDDEPCSCPEAVEICSCDRACDEECSEETVDISHLKLLTFGEALEKAKCGARIARKGWNGKNQYVFLAKELEFHTEADLSAYEKSGIYVHDALAFMGTSGLQVGWLASQADMLSNDWYIVE